MKTSEMYGSIQAINEQMGAIRNAAVAAGRVLTHEETAQINALNDEANQIRTQIHNVRNTDPNRSIFNAFGMNNTNANNPAALLDAGRPAPVPANGRRSHAKQMSEEYTSAFMSFIRSNGKHAPSALAEGFDPLFGGFALPSLPGMSAALYEGGSAAGGYAVSVPTDNLIVPLAVPDLGVRSVARVIPTATDIKIPSQSTFGTAGIKAESGSTANTFAESDPTLSQFTLSAFMLGLTHTVSWELLQDVATFQEFGVRDLLNAIDIAEDGYFVTGTGSSQPQGLVGNVGTGTGAAYAITGTAATDNATLLGATFDVIGTLKASYFANAGWLMSRATGTAIRKAQMQSNLYAQVWTRENGRDLLHGFPVTYSQNVPGLPTATTAGVQSLLFGSFADGYVIGDRGGTGTFIKILDQPLATSGQVVLLGYKRTDGRVRRSESIQAVSFSHS